MEKQITNAAERIGANMTRVQFIEFLVRTITKLEAMLTEQQQMKANTERLFR